MAVFPFQSGTPEPLLRATGVTIDYGNVRATENVSFDVHEGDRFVLLGPSGCGKSTLLKTVGGFITPTSGTLTLAGRRITAPGPDRIVVFQEFDQLPPWKTVKQNVMFPMLVSGVAKAEDFEEVVAAMKAGLVPTALLNTHRTTLDDFTRVLEHWMQPSAGVIKAIVEV